MSFNSQIKGQAEYNKYRKPVLFTFNDLCSQTINHYTLEKVTVGNYLHKSFLSTLSYEHQLK